MSEEKIILYESDQAATFHESIQVSGWVSRTGRFFGTGPQAEACARQDGATHKECETCGNMYAIRSYCKPCWKKKDQERFESLPSQEWDGESMLFSRARDDYFNDMDEVEDFLDDNPEYTLKSLELILCKPNYASIRYDFFDDLLAEDREPPKSLVDAIAIFNKTMSKEALSWSPTNIRLTIAFDKTNAGLLKIGTQ